MSLLYVFVACYHNQPRVHYFIFSGSISALHLQLFSGCITSAIATHNNYIFNQTMSTNVGDLHRAPKSPYAESHATGLLSYQNLHIAFMCTFKLYSSFITTPPPSLKLSSYTSNIRVLCWVHQDYAQAGCAFLVRIYPKDPRPKRTSAVVKAGKKVNTMSSKMAWYHLRASLLHQN